MASKCGRIQLALMGVALAAGQAIRGYQVSRPPGVVLSLLCMGTNKHMGRGSLCSQGVDQHEQHKAK